MYKSQHVDRGVKLVVILDDGQHQPLFETVHRQHSMLFRVVPIAIGDIAMRSAWEFMQLAHKGAQQPFDMPAIFGPRNRAELVFDIVVGAGSLEVLSLKVWTVIRVYDAWESPDRPFPFDSMQIQPSFLGQD